MNDRTLGRYLFPLVIIAALIWLAVQTLGGGGSDGRTIPFSQVLANVRQNAGDIQKVTFRPSSNEIEIRRVTGNKDRSVYPVDRSAFELQQLLEEKHIPFDAKRVGSSPWWSILTSLLPFVLLFGFWVFLMRNVKRGEPGAPGSPRSFN